jgi:hypothetical protein
MPTSSQAYQVIGNTIRIDAGTSPGTASIAPASGGFSGTTGPVVVKVENISNSSVDVFLNFSTTNPSVTSTIAVVGTPGTGVPIQHNSTAFIQVASGTVPATVYFAAAAASTTGIYITPVTLL